MKKCIGSGMVVLLVIIALTALAYGEMSPGAKQETPPAASGHAGHQMDQTMPQGHGAMMGHGAGSGDKGMGHGMMCKCGGMKGGMKEGMGHGMMMGGQGMGQGMGMGHGMMKGHGMGMGGAMEDRMKEAGHHLAKALKDLNLDEQQKKTIHDIKSRIMKETIRKMADIRIARIEIRDLLLQDPVDMKAVEAKLKQLGTIKTEMHLSHIKALEDIKAKLTPDQKKRFGETIKAGPMMGGMHE